MKNDTASSRKILPLASAVTFIGFLDTHLLIPIIALYAAGLGASTIMVGLIVGLYSLTNTPANILFGRLIDRVGNKRPLVLGLLGDAVSMLLYSISRLPLHLALVRVLHGIAGGMVGPATMSVIADYGGKRKGRAMGFYGTSIAAATLVGYGISGTVASRLGYHAVFFLGAALLVSGALLSLFLPGFQGRAPGREASGTGTRMMELLKRRGLIISYCSVFAQYFAFGGVVTLLPLFVRNLGMEAFHVGMSLVAFSVLFIVMQFPTGTLSDRVGRLFPVTAGLVIAIVALLLMPSVSGLLFLLVIMALYGAACGMIFPAASALVADSTDLTERGMAAGLFHALLTAGVAIGAPVIGWLGGTLGIGAGLALNSAVMLAALFVLLSFRKYIQV